MHSTNSTCTPQSPYLRCCRRTDLHCSSPSFLPACLCTCCACCCPCSAAWQSRHPHSCCRTRRTRARGPCKLCVTRQHKPSAQQVRGWGSGSRLSLRLCQGPSMGLPLAPYRRDRDQPARPGKLVASCSSRIVQHSTTQHNSHSSAISVGQVLCCMPICRGTVPHSSVTACGTRPGLVLGAAHPTRARLASGTWVRQHTSARCCSSGPTPLGPKHTGHQQLSPRAWPAQYHQQLHEAAPKPCNIIPRWAAAAAHLAVSGPLSVVGLVTRPTHTCWPVAM